MEITAAMVSKLREQTGAGMMECKKALVECGGDLEKAVDLLRVRGKAGAEKRAGRAAADGVVAAAVSGATAAMVELNSETDFVARNDEFRALAASAAEAAASNGVEEVPMLLALRLPEGDVLQHALDGVVARLRENLVLRRCAVVRAGTGELVNAYVHTVTNKIAVLVRLRGSADDPDHVSAARNVAMHIAASKPEFVCRADVPAGTLERERQVLAEKTRAEGKPETALPKIVEGRLGRFYEQTCAVEQPYVRDPSVKVGEMLRRAGVELLEYRLYVVGQE